VRSRFHVVDRRRHRRFEISGRLYAVPELPGVTTLKNVSAGGALVETELALTVQSLRHVSLVLREGGPELTGVVKHVSASSEQAAESTYAVGLEFVGLSATGQWELAQLMGEVP
jgi:hypothetical protein